MKRFRPLSLRNTPDARFDEYHEGLPAHLSVALQRWLATQITEETGMSLHGSHREPNPQFLERYQVECMVEPALSWRSGAQSAYEDLMTRVARDPGFALDTIDFALAVLPSINPYECNQEAERINSLLIAGNSVWEATPRSGGGWRLSRNSFGPVQEAISSTEGGSQRAHRHLVNAWERLGGRHPDPSGAYREAVRAVEAAAKPVVLPDDGTATLGKMIRAIDDKPEKWICVLGNPRDVAAMCGLLWTSQLDRHGTDDESVPLEVSREQADAAVHLAITLVRYFAGGLFRTAS